MRTCLAILLLGLLGGGPASSQPPPHPDVFCVGLYADTERTIACVTGQPDAGFEQHAWAWVPDDLGLAYITLRFLFPPELDLSARPVFHDSVTDLIISEYGGGTVEWNMVFMDCPSGWVEIFTQTGVVLVAEPAEIEILAAHSMVRDCTFVLNDVEVLHGLTVNDPECWQTAGTQGSWGNLKRLFR